jgi:hypothetical protein
MCALKFSLPIIEQKLTRVWINCLLCQLVRAIKSPGSVSSLTLEAKVAPLSRSSFRRSRTLASPPPPRSRPVLPVSHASPPLSLFPVFLAPRNIARVSAAVSIRRSLWPLVPPLSLRYELGCLLSSSSERFS